jgi:hypothetical protein
MARDLAIVSLDRLTGKAIPFCGIVTAYPWGQYAHSCHDPNTAASMTAAIRAITEASASPGTEIVATEPLWGPESIEGHFEGYLGAAALDRLATAPWPGVRQRADAS